MVHSPPEPTGLLHLKVSISAGPCWWNCTCCGRGWGSGCCAADREEAGSDLGRSSPPHGVPGCRSTQRGRWTGPSPLGTQKESAGAGQPVGHSWGGAWRGLCNDKESERCWSLLEALGVYRYRSWWWLFQKKMYRSKRQEMQWQPVRSHYLTEVNFGHNKRKDLWHNSIA